ncbi:signal transduction histidine kinase [Kutzneria viridogrisea]|uniref:histidine kinase n=1 Tax=Kutzneria viridogrisea TaxID=47990 RepID=A0ABR6BLH8_9PSEU|nr:signal transduction histidine kinase [Kutzneria viridogrisea]
MSARHRSSLPGGDGDIDPRYPDRTPPGLLGRMTSPRTIRGRLARILLVSLLLVLTLLGLTIVGEVRSYLDSGDTVRSVSLALTVQDLVHETQRERGLTNGLLGGETRFAQLVATQRTNTDHAVLALTNAVANGGAPGADSVRNAMTKLSGLNGVRDGVDAHRADRTATFQFYTDVITGLNQLRLGLDQAQDPLMRHGLQALYALGDAKEATGQERGFLNGVFAADRFGAGEYVHFTEIRANKVAGITAFQREATQEQRALLDAALRTDNASKAAAAETIAISSTKGPIEPQVDPVAWWTQMTSVIDEERKVQQAVGADVQQRAVALQGEAAWALGGFLVLALLAVAAEFLLVIGAMRSIVRPLAALSNEANDVAVRRLPAAVAAWHAPGDVDPAPPEPVRTPDKAGLEIASVADALNRVQSTAFELASEQALLRRNTSESLANLGRRNQNLVRRQLGFISEFEQEELDPSALSNLFELDHLATRMRRNAESLLVLVGEASPRRWAEPLSLSDVIRAGLSEVEDYRRVALRRVDEAWIAGSVVSELAHMLAELIENGLAFSPPDLEVEIYGRRLGARYMLAVVDHGVGMSKEQLAKANARLRGEEDFIVAPTRFLGHYVVGRLAQRLGIEVELTVSPVSGIVARLLLPAEMLVDEKDKRRPQPPRPELSAPAQHAQIEPPVPAAPPKPVVAQHEEEIQWPRDDVPAIESSQPGVRSRMQRITQERTVSEPARPKPEPAKPAPAAAPEPAPAEEKVPVQRSSAAGERTRNGLVKRTRRTEEARPSAPSRPPSAPAPSIVERSPEEVRSMLSSFRSGHQRGERGPLPSKADKPAFVNSTAPQEDQR